MTKFFVGIWRAALLVIAVVAGFILVGCTDDGTQPGCRDLERSILAKDICARLRNCELTTAQIEKWIREARDYRLYCVAPETKLPSVS